MTTLAYDGNMICVDSQATAGEIVTPRKFQKAFYDVGEYLVVMFAGSTAHYAPMLEWLREGADPKEHKDWECAAWGVKADGSVLRYVGPYPEVVDGIDADGTGAGFAIGAMAAGATALEAVRIASQYDLYTGVTVRVFYIPKTKAEDLAA